MYIIDLPVTQVLFLCAYLCTSVLKATIVHPMAISTLPRWGRSKLICPSHTYTHTATHITAELIKHNATGREQDWGKKSVSVWWNQPECSLGEGQGGQLWQLWRREEVERKWEKRRGKFEQEEEEKWRRQWQKTKLKWQIAYFYPSSHQSICMAYTSNCNAMQSEMHFIMLIFCTFTAAL